jgi:hypothetical protein
MIMVSMFPKTLRLEASKGNYGWSTILRDDEGSCIFLTDKLADRLAEMLAERKAKMEEAA